MARRVLVVDDHPLFRRGIMHILAGGMREVVVGEAGSVEQASSTLRAEPWDLVVLDISMPGQSGLELLKQIVNSKVRPGVLVVSQYSEREYATKVLRMGADGYLPKSAASEQLLDAVRKVLSGAKFVSPELAQLLVSELTSEPEPPPHKLLSTRELDVMRRLASGESPKEIAGALAVSSKTVSSFRARILRKMRMKTNAELIHYAFKNSLIE